MHENTNAQAGFKRQVVFRIGAEDWQLLQAAAAEHGSIQAAVLAGIRALQPAPNLRSAERRAGAAAAAAAKPASQPHSSRRKAVPVPAPASDEEIRAREAAQLLGLKTSTVSGYIRSGRLPGRHDEAPTWLGWMTTRAAVEDYRRLVHRRT